MVVEARDEAGGLAATICEAMKTLDGRAQPWQAAIKTGDYFRRGTPYGFPIYGEVLPDEEPRDEHVRHYRLCKCYSVVCVAGEMGNVHVSTIEKKLSEAEFEKARERGWYP